MWLFEQTLVATQSGINNIVHDGRDVWAAVGSSIKVYSYIDEEYLAQEYQLDRGVFSLNLVTTITHTSAITDMCCLGDSVYVMSGADISIYNKHTYSIVGTAITIPIATQPAMFVANNKLWFVTIGGDVATSPGGVPTSDCQQLYFYDLIAQTWSSPILIPGKKQYITRSLVDGLDGHIYISNMNDHAILKFTTAGVYVGQYRINRHPYFLQCNQDKEVFVVSDAQSDPLKGMVSIFNQTTNTSTNYAGACGTLLYMADDGNGKLHYIGGTSCLTQLTKADKKLKYKQDPESDNFVPGAALMFDIGTTLGGLVTPQLTFDVWNGSAFVSKTVKPYAFLYNSGELYAVRLSSLVRVNSMDVLGTAMIATGAQNYYGDL